MKLQEKFPVLGSSANPETLSMTVKGILLAVLPVVILVAQANNWPLSENDFMEFIEGFTAALSAIMTFYGLVRKLVNKFKKK